MKTIILAVLLIFLMFPITHAEQGSYLCSAVESTGYDYTNGRWLRERFRPDARFQVKQNDSVWSIYEYETENEHTTCVESPDQVLKCAINGDFIMDMKTMKFSVTDTAPYVHSTRKNRDSVVLTLGTCVPM